MLINILFALSNNIWEQKNIESLSKFLNDNFSNINLLNNEYQINFCVSNFINNIGIGYKNE